MHTKLWLILAVMAASPVLSACAPLIIGGAAAVVADEAMEQKNGGDGLF